MQPKRLRTQIVGGLAGLVGGTLGTHIVVAIAIQTYRANSGKPGLDRDTHEAISLCAGAVGTVVGWISASRQLTREDESRLAEERAAARQMELDAEASTRDRLARIEIARSAWKSSVLSARSTAAKAERAVERAETEFAQGAFSPFWSEVEHAGALLQEYSETLAEIRRRRATCESLEEAPASDGSPTPLPGVASTTARLGIVVRSAQRDPTFSLIFEQRRTTMALLRGFTTLESAIDSIGKSISWQLSDLGESLASAHAEGARRTVDAIERVEKEAERRAVSQGARDEAAARRSEEQSKMLDNIQRRRKPFP
jgi:hypothetical protein